MTHFIYPLLKIKIWPTLNHILENDKSRVCQPWPNQTWLLPMFALKYLLDFWKCLPVMTQVEFIYEHDKPHSCNDTLLCTRIEHIGKLPAILLPKLLIIVGNQIQFWKLRSLICLILDLKPILAKSNYVYICYPFCRPNSSS